MQIVTRVFPFLAALAAVAPPALADSEVFVSVCARQAPFEAFLTSTLAKPCDQITSEDLAAVKRVAVPGRELATVTADDVANLPALEILNITRNPLNEGLPEGLLAALPALKTLVMFGTELTSLPEDFLEANPHIENLHLFDNPFVTIPDAVLERLEYAAEIKVIDLSEVLEAPVKDRLRARFPLGGPVELTFY